MPNPIATPGLLYPNVTESYFRGRAAQMAYQTDKLQQQILQAQVNDLPNQLALRNQEAAVQMAERLQKLYEPKVISRPDGSVLQYDPRDPASTLTEIRKADPGKLDVKELYQGEQVHQVLMDDHGKMYGEVGKGPRYKPGTTNNFLNSPGGQDSVEAMKDDLLYGRVIPEGRQLQNAQDNPVKRAYAGAKAADPTYSVTAAEATRSLRRSYESGVDSRRMTSMNGAYAHMDQYAEIMKAIDGGDIRTANRIAQGLGFELGGTKQAAAEGMANFLGHELESYLAPGGGTGEGRKGFENTLSAFKAGKAQGLEVINTYRSALMEQARAHEQKWVGAFNWKTARENNVGKMEFRGQVIPELAAAMDAEEERKAGQSAAPSGDVAKPATEAEYNALPSGALYVRPGETQVRRKK